MWYDLRTSLNKKETLVELSGSYQNMQNYFILNIDNDKFIQNAPLRGIAQDGFTPKLLLNADYLDDVRMGNIPIFSKKFVEALGDKLQEYIEFYPCLIYLHDVEYPFYLARIKNRLSVIDEQKSGYRILTDGSKIIDEPIIIREEVNEGLLIVRTKNDARS